MAPLHVDGEGRRCAAEAAAGYFTCNGVNLETFYPTTPYGALTVDLVEDDFTQLQSLGKEDAMALACGATNVACSTTARSCGATRAAAR